MKNLQKIFLSLSILTMIMILSCCGRYAAPEPIQESGYPHNYPQQ